MIKTCTDIPQSNKLLSLGLGPSTADMHYREWKRATKDIRIAHMGTAGKEDLPAWSLTAMLKLMPNGYSLGNRAGKYYVCFTHIKQERIELYDEPVDAAFEAVCRLIEQGHIKVNK